MNIITSSHSNVTVDNKKQFVLNSLNLGQSSSQLQRLKTIYLKEYHNLAVQNILKKSLANLNDGIPKNAIIAFDDDFVQGWCKKFVNERKEVLSYLKNLTVITVDFIDVTAPLSQDSALKYCQIQNVKLVCDYMRLNSVHRNGFFNYLLLQTWQDHAVFNNINSHPIINENNVNVFTLGSMRSVIYNSIKSLKYSQILEIDKMRYQGNSFPWKLLPMSFRSFKEHGISIINLISCAPILQLLKCSFVPSLGDYPKFKNQLKMQWKSVV